MSKKITLEQANELLKLLQVEAAVVSNTDDDPADEDVDLQKIVQSVPIPDAEFQEAQLRAKIEDDIRSQVTGQFLGKLRSKVSQTFGVKRTELESLDIEEILNLGKSSHESAFNKTQKEWLDDRQRLIEQVEKEKETLVGEYEQKLREKDNMFVLRDKKERCIQLLNSIPRVGGNVAAQAEALLKHMEENFSTAYDADKKAIPLFRKDDPTKPLFEGKKVLSDEDVAKRYADEMGWLASGTQHVKPSDVANNSGIKTGVQTQSSPQTTAKLPDNIPEEMKQAFEKIEALKEAE